MPLRISYTPDSDDIFNYYAWENGFVTLDAPGHHPEFHRDHIHILNQAALAERFDVVAVSSVLYPRLADRYWVLAVGNSIGRGVGPVLVSKHYSTLEELRGKRVAVGGMLTTGSTLAQMYCPHAEFVELPYTAIADAIAENEIEAGVMIHEEIMYFPKKGLRSVYDLGRAWLEDTGLPLPIGLNLVRRELGRELAVEVATVCERSLVWAFDHSEEVFAYASQFGRGQAQTHVAMFKQEDTLRMPADVRRAMSVLFERVHAMGLGPKLDAVEVLEGKTRVGT
jgi:1,4-dihydroxy-6-naphthoate synthase